MSEQVIKLKKSNLDYIKGLYIQEMKRRGWSERTIEEYSNDITQFLKFIQSAKNITDIRDITPKDVSDYQNFIFYYKKKDDTKYAIYTQINKLVRVRSFFDFLIRTNRIIVNPTSNIILPKEEKRLPKKPLIDRELNAIFNVINKNLFLGFRDYTILKLLYITGIRVTELARIKTTDINFYQKLLNIHGKGDKYRLVPLTTSMINLLKEYITEVRSSLLNKTQTDILFLTISGNQLRRNEINSMIIKYCEKAGIKRKIGAHHFRVTCATRMMEGGANLRYIQEMLGHEKMETTERYLKVSVKALKEEHGRRHPREVGYKQEKEGLDFFGKRGES